MPGNRETEVRHRRRGTIYSRTSDRDCQRAEAPNLPMPMVRCLASDESRRQNQVGQNEKGWRITSFSYRCQLQLLCVDTTITVRSPLTRFQFVFRSC